MVLYELCVLLAAYLAYRILRSRFKVVPELAAAFAPAQVQGAFVLMAVLAVVGGIAIYVLRDADAVTVCRNNEQTIAAALSAYESATGSPYPASSAVNVVRYNGTTAGTFSNPNQSSVDYLGTDVIDPVNTTAHYTLTVTAKTVSTPETYTIQCPGPHSKADLAQLSGSGTATAGKVQLANGVYSAI